MNKKRIKKYLIITLVLIEIISIALTYKSFMSRNLNEIKEESIVDRKRFAMYISNDTGGYDEYTTSDFFPVGYNLNLDKSSCMDANGNILSGVLTGNGNNITVTSNKSMYCYLYFDLDPYFRINVSTDGTSGVVPTGNTYTQTLSCTNATAEYSSRYRRIEVSALTSGSKCNLDYVKDTSTKTTLASIVQANATTITSTNNAGTTDTSYRYTGKNPNNYVWFNNEMWRIIGLIPTCTASGCSTKENLVKIIRNESIGGLAYDAKSSGSGAWRSNTLYKLLNNYYYGKSDGTNSGYCYGYYASSYKPIVGCDYTNIGISSDSTDYYGRMIKNVYWNTGASAYNATASAVYTTETATQTVSGKIGLMAASDFGYAASTSYHSTSMSSYSSAVATDWLYGQGEEWTSIRHSGGSDRALSVRDLGNLNYSYANNGYAARPVLYLYSSVYKITGEGTQANPYIIGM